MKYTVFLPSLDLCLQESYCGYPGFHLNCSKHGYPTISLPENDYIVESISYPNRSFRVYNAAVSSTSNLRCLPQIINTTFPTREFRYVNASMLYLLSNCTEPLSNDLLQYKVVCQGDKRDNLVLALWDEDENLQKGLENCEKHVVAPVEVHGDEERIGMGEYEEILRRGFALNWSVEGDCRRCERSGGRCGFNSTTFRFRCFCRDGPGWSCRPRTDSVDVREMAADVALTPLLSGSVASALTDPVGVADHEIQDQSALKVEQHEFNISADSAKATNEGNGSTSVVETENKSSEKLSEDSNNVELTDQISSIDTKESSGCSADLESVGYVEEC
ncbi:unnamed protein product [Fraxinus pennsylvanica]|uniref:non-specific serine/threonine protein kinase n=1 Tax=Fraxinus pennsylvanica TaxID=56036 RepID=A0AAD2A0L1_9LAMI|nr:unnamed protein product [Fraxinus pennsylvanica]